MPKSTTEELAQLLLQAQAGDNASLQRLCRELQQSLRGYFRQKFQDSNLVDDLCQETYIRLLKSLPAVAEPMKLRSFVVKVAIHVSQDYLRKKYRRKEEELAEQFGDSSEDMRRSPPATISDDGPDELLDRMDLDEALALFPEKTRRILLMMAGGYKYEEIAEEMSLSVSSVKMQVKRSLESLRASLLLVTFWLVSTTVLVAIVS